MRKINFSCVLLYCFLPFKDYLYADERKDQQKRCEDSMKEVNQSTVINSEEKVDRRAQFRQTCREAIAEIDNLEIEFGKEIKSKCDLIMVQAIELLEKNPGYQLYIAGHSMGGALATLFGAEAATNESPHIPKPVTCISFSSPKVGNIAFKQVYEKLERDGLIRKVRVLNSLDPVPKIPSAGICRIPLYVLCPARIMDAYSHVGIALKLKETGFTISYDKYRGVLWLLFKEMLAIVKGFVYFFYLIFLLRITKLLQYHTCSEILNRLRDNMEYLEKEGIDQLYDRIKQGEDGILSFRIITKPEFMEKRRRKSSRKVKQKRRAGNVMEEKNIPIFSSFNEPLLSESDYDDSENDYDGTV